MTSACTIYALLDPATRAIRYIGKTSYPRSRLQGHLIEAARGHACDRCDWIRSIQAVPVLRPMVVVEHGEGARIERRAIALFRRKGYRLTNQTIGGEGGFVPDELKIERLAMKARARAAVSQHRAERRAAGDRRRAEQRALKAATALAVSTRRRERLARESTALVSVVDAQGTPALRRDAVTRHHFSAEDFKFFSEHGKRGGEIGGRVRAARMTAAERTASATKASRAAAKARTAAAKARKAAAE